MEIGNHLHSEQLKKKQLRAESVSDRPLYLPVNQ